MSIIKLTNRTTKKNNMNSPMKSSIKALTLAMATMALALLSACASTSSIPRFELPQSSAAYNRTAISNTIITTLDQYLLGKLECQNWTLIDVTNSQAQGQLVFTQAGELYQGQFSETWLLSACGKDTALTLALEPNPSGGAIIKIRRER